MEPRWLLTKRPSQFHTGGGKKTSIVVSSIGLLSLALPVASLAAEPASISSIHNQTVELTQSSVITPDANSEGNRPAGIIADSNKKTKVTMSPGVTLSIKGTQNGTRIYGAVSATGSSIDVQGPLDIDVTNTAGRAVGLRANGGDITVTGNTTINVVGTGEHAVGLDTWYTGNLHLAGDLNATVVGNTDRLMGIQNFEGKTGGGTVVIDGKSTFDLTNNGTGYTHGINVNCSTTTFNDDASFKILAPNSISVRAVETQSDANRATIVNFNGATTSFDVEGKNEVLGLRPSGHDDAINLNGKQVNLNLTSLSGDATGLRAQYEGSIQAQANLNGNITAKNNAYGAIVTAWGDNFGNISLSNATLSVTAKEQQAIGLLIIPGEAPSQDVKPTKDYGNLEVLGNLDLTVNAVKDQALGVYSSIVESNLKILGQQNTISVTAGTQAYGLHAADGTRIVLGSKNSTNTVTASSQDAQNVAAAVYVGAGATIALNGATTLNAATALAGSGVVENIGNLTLNGTVQDFTGSFTHNAGVVSVNDKTGYFGGTVAINGGTLNLQGLTLAPTTLEKTTLTTGSIQATSGQFFTNALAADGLNSEAGAAQLHGLTLAGGTLSLTDAKYNLDYANSATTALKSDKTQLVFTGTLVAAPQDVQTAPEGSQDNKLTLDQAATTGGNAVFTEATLDTSVGSTATQNNLVIGQTSDADPSMTDAQQVSNSVGVKNVQLTEGTTGVTVNANKTLTLVGDGTSGNLLNGATADVTVTVGGNTTQGALQLGVKSEAAQSGGTLNANVAVNANSTLTVAQGNFEVENSKTLTNSGTLAIDDKAQLKVGTLKLDAGTVNVAGELAINKLEAGTGLINIGNATKAGLASVSQSLGGHEFFLDPAFDATTGIAGASKLIYSNATLSDKILAGQNSYVIMGNAADEADFLTAFNQSGNTWSATGVTAAAYLAKPLTVDATTGALVVDGSKTTYEAPANGEVTLAANSLLVANMANYGTAPMISTTGTVTVDPTAKLVLTNVQAGTNYEIVSGAAGWASANVSASNAMFQLSGGTGATGSGLQFTLTSAATTYGNFMQGTALADAAMSAAGADYTYANNLLGVVGATNAQSAATFDAAMNPAGAVAMYTSAYDRAAEHREIMRRQIGQVAGGGLWVEAAGGQTKLDGIATGAQDISVKGNHFGMTVGADIALTDRTVGVAFTGGKGSMKNKAVAAENSFNYYNISAYDQMHWGDYTVTMDAGAALVKSELAVGGPANASSDVDTAVYSVGIEGKRAFDVAGATVEPFVGLDVYHMRSGAFDTAHGVHVNAMHATSVEMPIGARAFTSFDTQDGTSVKPMMSLAVIPAFGDKDADTQVQFAGAQSPYEFTMVDDVKAKAQLGISAFNKNFAVSTQVGYDWGNESRSAVNGSVNVRFVF